MTEAWQLIAYATREIVKLTRLGPVQSAGCHVLGRQGHAHDISLECVPTGGGSCACAFEGQMPLPTKVVPDYSGTSVISYASTDTAFYSAWCA